MIINIVNAWPRLRIEYFIKNIGKPQGTLGTSSIISPANRPQTQ